MQSLVEVQGLDHGFFQFPRPTTRHIIGYIIAAVLFMVSYGMYASSLGIPDVPRVEEADVLPSLFQTLQTTISSLSRKGTTKVTMLLMQRLSWFRWNWRRASSPTMIAVGRKTMKETAIGIMTFGWQTQCCSRCLTPMGSEFRPILTDTAP